MGHRGPLFAVAVAAMVLVGCDPGPSPEPGSSTPTTQKLTPAGRVLLERAGLEQAPRYALAARLRPATGRVEASLDVTLPTPESRAPLRFRVYPNLPDLRTGFRLSRLEVNGHRQRPDLDRSVLRVTVPADADRQTVVAMTFSYSVGEAESESPFAALLGGDSLTPSTIGLLARRPGALALGHWFPVLIAPGAVAEPDPKGFGDIGNFPAAIIQAEIDVPAGWRLLTSGRTVATRRRAGRVVQVEEGVGVRDLSIYIARDLRASTVHAGTTVVRASGPKDQVEELGGIAREAAQALTVLAAAFGPYPWPELDVVSVPLGAGVGGMEWQGAIWITDDIAAGGIPGLGDLGPLGDLGGLLGGLGLGATVDTLREFVIAHEVGHQWWHALVGNDSTVAAAVDEPLAQFSACLYWERQHGAAAAQEVCPLHIQTQYRTMRSLGNPDAPADQPSSAFASSFQYGGVVYGKAPGFYAAARALVGEEALLSGLRALARDQAYSIVKPADVLAALQAAAPSQADELGALWRHWMQEAHGDADVGVEAGGGLGALFGPGAGLDPEQLAALERALEQILGPTTSTTAAP